MKKKYVVNFLSIFCVLYGVEVIFRLIADLPLFDLAMVRITYGVVILSTIVTFFSTLMKYKISKYFILAIDFVASFYAWLQLGFDNFLGVYASFQNAEQGGAVKDYVLDFIKSFLPSFYLVYIPVLLYIAYIVFFSKRFNGMNKMKLRYNALYSAFVVLVCMSTYFTTLINPVYENKYSAVKNQDLFMTVSNQGLSISSFGPTMFGLLDVRTTIFKSANIETEEDIDFVNDKQVEKDITENTRVINDTAWKELIANTTNPTYNKLNNYFINQPISDKNEMTGIFEGKNVIFILMESVNEIITEHPEYYPNFAKMANDGWYFENNYSPRNACATLNNEFSGMTSLYSIHSICTAKKYRNNQYPESVFGIYKDAGYTTFSAHNYTEAYYPRNSIHRNMGSEDYYGVQRLGISYSNEYINWSNDDDFMEEILKIIDKKRSNSNNKPFMTWLTTVSGHQPYTVDSIQGSKYLSMTNGTGLPTDVRRFMSKLKIMDNGFGILLEGLEKRGILDDTVIVLYGDHYPYGLSKDHINKALSYNTNKDMSAEKVPLVIYNSAVKGKRMSGYTSYLNVVPTLANMSGLDFDPRLYLGTDVFSDDYESLVVFSDGSWKNEYGYYKASSNKMTYYQDGMTEAEIARINSVIETKTKLSELAITNNYFKYLRRNLDSINEKLHNETLCLNKEKEDWLNGTHSSIFKIEEADVVVADDDGLTEDEGPME